MFDLLTHIFRQGLATRRDLFAPLDDACIGLPTIDRQASCSGDSCGVCKDGCPTSAIGFSANGKNLSLDLGACIGCGLCVDVCPTAFLKKDLGTKTSVSGREALVLSSAIVQGDVADATHAAIETASNAVHVVTKKLPFRDSLSVRVVSTGCSACDLEIGAAFNPIFDSERFGIKVVASPRGADALLVTGPVGSSMREALLSTYDAMAEPRLVIAVGSCAISGGVHGGAYAHANGVSSVLPVDVFIPGCPPHPFSILHGLFLAMGRKV